LVDVPTYFAAVSGPLNFGFTNVTPAIKWQISPHYRPSQPAFFSLSDGRTGATSYNLITNDFAQLDRKIEHHILPRLDEIERRF
jgi:hypothetical protein